MPTPAGVNFYFSSCYILLIPQLSEYKNQKRMFILYVQ